MNDNKFAKLNKDHIHFLRREARYGHVDGAEWVLDGTVPEGTAVRLHHETNAGFRGLEWSCETKAGIHVHGISVTDLSDDEVRCSICGHPIITVGDHTPARHRRVGIVDNRDLDPQDEAENLVVEMIEQAVGEYGGAFAKKVLARAAEALRNDLRHWDDTMEMLS